MKLCSNGNSNSTLSNNSEDDYLHQLECLNTSVAEWITQHVQRNPLVDLTPIFRDYEAHLSSLDQKRKQFNNEPVTRDTSVTTTLPIITETVQATSDSEVISESKSDHMISGSDHVISSVAPAISTTGICVK